MSRSSLILLSLVDCALGIIAITTDGSIAEVALGLNFVLAALLAVLTWQDLRQRNWSWQAPVIGLSYLAAPLVGLVLYAWASGRPAGGTSATNHGPVEG